MPDIRISVNARMRQGWRLEWRRWTGAVLTIPKSLSQAPDEIKSALLEWAELTQKRKRSDSLLKKTRKELENRVHAWVKNFNDVDGESRKRTSRRAENRLQRLQPAGKHCDLEAVLTRINNEYFEGGLRARITWSSRWGGLSTQSTQRDGEGQSYSLITVSRGYDHPSATAEIVGGVVYHECLHIAIPPEERTERRVVHSREFRRREKEYRHYEEWQRWHRETLPRIIRKRPGYL